MSEVVGREERSGKARRGGYKFGEVEIFLGVRQESASHVDGGNGSTVAKAKARQLSRMFQRLRVYSKHDEDNLESEGKRGSEGGNAEVKDS